MIQSKCQRYSFEALQIPASPANRDFPNEINGGPVSTESNFKQILWGNETLRIE
jgi:hypothetical protein